MKEKIINLDWIEDLYNFRKLNKKEKYNLYV